MSFCRVARALSLHGRNANTIANYRPERRPRTRMRFHWAASGGRRRLLIFSAAVINLSATSNKFRC